VQAGGFISRAQAPRQSELDPGSKHDADLAMEAAACIGCGACAAACPMDRPCFSRLRRSRIYRSYHRASGTRQSRTANVNVMDAEGFGNCTNTYECEAVCPAEISASFIAKLNREYARAAVQRSAGE